MTIALRIDYRGVRAGAGRLEKGNYSDNLGERT